jgi:integrase
MDRIKGEGSWRKRSDGRYEYAVPTGKTHNGHTRRKSFYGRTKKDAFAKYEQWTKNRFVGKSFDQTKLTLNAFFTQHLDHLEKVQRRISNLTRVDYEAQFRRHISPYLGHVQLSDIKPANIVQWQADLIEAGLGPRTLEYTYKILKAAFESATKLRLISENPSDSVPAPKKIKPIKQSYTKVEARDYLRAATGLRLEALFLLVLTTGIRRSEVLGLRWQDLDFDRMEVRVRQRIRWKAGGGFDIDVPKTLRSRRTIPISTTIRTALERLREEQVLQRIHAGENWKEHELMFTSRYGNPLHSSTLTAMHEAIIKRAGIKRLTFHELRHSFTSLARAAGVDLKAISDILGHHSVAFTMDFYQHLFEDQLQAVARSADELVGALLAEPVKMTKARLALWQAYAAWLETQPNTSAYLSKTPARFRTLLEQSAAFEREYVAVIGAVVGAGWTLLPNASSRFLELEKQIED